MCPSQRKRDQAGFTYLMLMWCVAIGGVMLAALGQQWLTESRRQKEMELVFRGEQIQVAIQSYYDATPNGPKTLPSQWRDLLEDRRGPTLKRHLRQVYAEPITRQGQWVVLRDGGLIKGVHSPSILPPLGGHGQYPRYDAWRFDTQLMAPVLPTSDEKAGAPSALMRPAQTLPSARQQNVMRPS